MTDPYNLQRFVDAQNRVYDQVRSGEPDPSTLERL